MHRRRMGMSHLTNDTAGFCGTGNKRWLTGDTGFCFPVCGSLLGDRHRINVKDQQDEVMCLLARLWLLPLKAL